MMPTAPNRLHPALAPTQRLHRTRIRAVLAAALALALVGCSTQGYPGHVQPGLTSAEAEAITNERVNDAIAQIDPTLTQTSHVAFDEDLSCGDGVSNPTRKVREWATIHNVWLVEGADSVAILNPIIDGYLADGWKTTIDRPATDQGGRVVQMFSDKDAPNAAFGLHLSAGVEGYIRVGSSSPCSDSTLE